MGMSQKRYSGAIVTVLIVGFIPIVAISDEGAEEEFTPGEDGCVSRLGWHKGEVLR